MKTDYEIIIIGGSYAGLSAAMALGRSLRNVLVIDSGRPCNRHTPHSHNFLTQDGEAPAAISAKAIAQVRQYPSVAFFKGKAVFGTRNERGFSITTDSGDAFTATKLLFATGITDIMPNIDGFEDCWGISAVHCPYCHGYETKGEKTAILANGDAAMHYAMLLRQLTNSLTIFTNGPAAFNSGDLLKLGRHDIEIIEDRIAGLRHDKGYIDKIIMQDGKAYKFGVMYYRPSFEQHCGIPRQLGCTVNEMGYIVVDEMQQTSVAGVYAAGDCTSPMRSVAMAVATGNKAGAALNSHLAAEAFG